MAFTSFAFDRVRFNTATTGTGTITVGSAVSGFMTPASIGVPDGTILSFYILDGTNWEKSTGAYTASGTTLARTLVRSSTGSLLSLSGSAVVIVSPGADDFDFIMKRDTANGNVFLGGAGNYSASGIGNFGAGPAALASSTNAVNNMVIGNAAGQLLTSGGYNVALGASSLSTCVSGAGNVAIGSGTLNSATNGFNIAIGFYSGFIVTTGVTNIIIGGAPSANRGPTSGSHNILIGHDAELASPTADNQICIANIIYGTGVTGSIGQGSIGIGTLAPDRKFHVEDETAVTNAINYLERLTALSTGTPAVGIGVGIEFEIETTGGNFEIVPLQAKVTAVGAGAEAIIWEGQQMAAGALQDAFGVSPIMKMLTANAAYTSNTSAQPWFPSGGAVTLEASTSYEFEGHLLLATTAATTTHTMAIGFGGTATLTSIAYRADAHHAAANTTQPTSTAALSNATAVEQAASTVVTGLSGTTSALRTSIWVRGIIRVNAAGTVIPQFTFSAARGAGNVLPNTFFKLRKIGSNTIVNQGPWA